jgi:prophage regulatory protein
MSYRILRLHSVKKRTGLSRSTIYLRIAQGTFPKQIGLGGRAVGWVEEDIERWLIQQIEQSRCLTA